MIINCKRTGNQYQASEIRWPGAMAACAISIGIRTMTRVGGDGFTISGRRRCIINDGAHCRLRLQPPWAGTCQLNIGVGLTIRSGICDDDFRICGRGRCGRYGGLHCSGCCILYSHHVIICIMVQLMLRCVRAALRLVLSLVLGRVRAALRSRYVASALRLGGSSEATPTAAAILGRLRRILRIKIIVMFAANGRLVRSSL